MEKISQLLAGSADQSNVQFGLSGTFIVFIGSWNRVDAIVIVNAEIFLN
jgi:hypothetical protein